MKPYLMTAKEVQSRLNVSRNTAYIIIRELNAELEAKGLRTIHGKVNSQYFEDRYFTSDPEKRAAL